MSTWRKSSYSPEASDCVEVSWRKSSHSPSASDCVEVGWQKSSHSASGSECVEVGRSVGIRDSKAPATHLPVSEAAWSALLQQVKSSLPG
ncbi:protein of unknown function [Lentzea fradiae]|uniref:DUF397 domain-containing protein n=1 Tax=Lentzea fradiae TaxID=200378 RepID=A0A1G7X367_9PSEU|nr:DUF397 domain-containing protein [Lentzea fradiae]SDG78625.1 protein of unknown function [Lentzea fradiae]